LEELAGGSSDDIGYQSTEVNIATLILDDVKLLCKFPTISKD